LNKGIGFIASWLVTEYVEGNAMWALNEIVELACWNQFGSRYAVTANACLQPCMQINNCSYFGLAECRANSRTPRTRVTRNRRLHTGQVAFEWFVAVVLSWWRLPRTGRRLPSHSFFIIIRTAINGLQL
jgi:hypothetical protein